MTEHSAWTRRRFLAQGLAFASASACVPAFLQRSAFALPASMGLSSLAGVPQDRVLVVVQLSGGNDGLNTVVPYTNDLYFRHRPGIAIRAQQALALSQNGSIGLHPALSGVKALYDQGLCSIVQGVGYPNPNRSHFMSMDIWQTADTDGTGDGWLGRYFDNQCCGYGKGESGRPENGPPTAAAANGAGLDASGQPGIALGREAPLAMQGRKVKPIAFETPQLFRWSGEDVHEALVEPYHDLVRRGQDGGGDTNADFLMRTALDAQVSSELIRKAVARAPRAEYPRTQLGQQLAMVSAMIAAGLDTRVYYVTLGGFDTHAGQGGPQGQHARLLSIFGDALKAFYDDLREQENAERVLTMSFSEFGRRVAQNASGGTDHGTAAPMMLFGPMVRPGVIGDHPSLKDLDQGDLKFGLDFRSVYAGILEGWMQADSEAVLGRKFRPAVVVRG